MHLDDAAVVARFESNLFAAMVTAVELTGIRLAADLGAARLFRGPRRVPASYANGRRLKLEPSQAKAILEWPEKNGSLLSVLPYHHFRDAVFRPADLMPDRIGDPRLYHPVSEAAPVCDSIGACVSLDDHAWIALIWLRCGMSRAFAPGDIRDLTELYSALAARLVEGYRANHSRAGVVAPSPVDGQCADTLYGRLSDTEKQVFECLRAGMTEREVGDELGRSRHTVHVHVKSIYRKLGVYSRRELIQKFTGE